MARSIIKMGVQLLLAGLPVIMALDLLYLYFAGSWYDPIKWIEITEVSMLIVISAVYLILFIVRIRERYRDSGIRS